MLRLFAKLHHDDDGEYVDVYLGLEPHEFFYRPSIDELLTSQMLMNGGLTVRPKPDALATNSRCNAKLIADIERCFKQSGRALNIERLRPLADFDFRHGLINKDEFLDILVAQNIDDILEPLMPRILSFYGDNEGRIE